MTHNHFVSAAGLVWNDNRQILLVKSPRRGWEYPGGLLEPGETVQQALLREIREEAGVEVAILRFVGICKNLDKNIVNIDFVCRYLSGDLQTSEESTEVCWVSPEKALEMVTFPLTKKRLFNMLTGEKGVHVFGFRHDPFRTYGDAVYPVGEVKLW